MAAETTPASNPASPAPAPLRRRRWPKIVAALLLVLILLVAFAPKLIGSFGKGAIESVIDDTIRGSVAIDSLSLSWFGGQKITGITLNDPEGKRVATVRTLSTDLSIWKAITGDLNLGKVLIEGVDGDVKVAEDGSTNLQRAIEMVKPSPETDEPASVPPSLALDAELRDANVTVTPVKGEPTHFTDLTARVQIPSLTQPVTLSFSGKTQQGATGGSLKGDGSLSHLFDQAGLLTPQRLEGKLTAEAAKVPAEGLDGLLAMAGVLREALGGNVDARVDASFTGSQQTAVVTLTAPHLSATLKGDVAAGRFALAEPAKLEFTATPAFAAAVAKLVGSADTLALQGPATITVLIDKLSAPAGAFDPAAVVAHARITATPIELGGLPQIGEASIRGFQLTIATDNLAQAVALRADAQLTSGPDSGVINADARVANLFDASGKFDADAMTPAGQVLVTNLPLALVDKLIPPSVHEQMKVTLVEALGPQLLELRIATADYKPAGADTSATQAPAAASAGAPAAKPAKTLALDLVARTQLLALSLPVELGDRIATRAPASLRYDAPRSVAVAFGAVPAQDKSPDGAVVPGLRLESSTKIELSNLTFSAPRPAEGQPAFQPDKTTVAGKLTVSNVAYTAADTSHFSIEQTSVTLLEGPLSAVKMSAHTTAVATNGHGTLARALGYAADVDFDGVVNVSESGVTGDDLHLSVTGKRSALKVDLLAQLTSHALILKRPGELAYEVTPQFLAETGLWPQGVAPLAGPTPIGVSIAKLYLPIKDFNVAAVEVVVNGSIVAAAPGDLVGELFGPKLAFSLSQTPAQSASQPGKVALRLESDRVKADAEGKLTFGQGSALVIDDPAEFVATITPRALALLNLAKEGQPTLAEPATLRIAADDTHVPLDAFAMAKLRSKLTAEVDKLVLAGDAKVAGASLRDLKTVEPIVFDGPGNALSMKLAGSATAPGQTGDASPIAIAATARNLLDAKGELAVEQAAIAADVNVQKLPTAVVEVLTGNAGGLTPYVGQVVDLKLTAQTTGGPKTGGTVELIARSELLAADAKLTLADRVVSLAAPAKVRWTMTRDAFAGLAPVSSPDAKGAFAYKLAEPATINATLTSLAATLPGEGEAFNVASVKLAADIASDSIKLVDERGGPAADRGSPVALANVKGTASTAGGGAAIVAHLSADTTTGQNPGKLTLDVQVEDLIASSGQVNDVNDAAVSLTLDGKQLPTVLIDQLVSQDGLLATALGETVDARAQATIRNMTGPVKFDATSPKSGMHLDGRLTNGVLTLNEDMTAGLIVTEKLSRYFFNHPILKQAVKSYDKVTLTIAKDGFSAPLTDFDIKKVEMPRATLDPGKMLVKNAGLIELLLKLPQTVKSVIALDVDALRARKEIDAWFTPLDIAMKDGVATFSRMDMLLGQDYQIATWGTLNFGDRTISVGKHHLAPNEGRMILGIGERGLRRIYGIKRYKDNKDYVEQFVMHGPIDKLGPDTADMTVRLVGLTTVGITGTGGIGEDVLKGIGIGRDAFDRVVNKQALEKRQFDTPPAARKPFPWQDEKQAAEEPAESAPAQGVAPTQPAPGTPPTQPTPTPTPPAPPPAPNQPAPGQAEPAPQQPAPTPEESEAEKERKREERRKKRQEEKDAEKSDAEKVIEGIEGIFGGDKKDEGGKKKP